MIDTYLEAWNEYISLENDFKDIISHIPLVEEHQNVWSLKIGDILIVLGSVLDSFLKYSINDTVLDGIADINKIRNKSELNMVDYRKIFDSFYNLSSKYVYVRHMEKRIQPFANWSNNKSLKWWNAYQSVKHDRFANKKEATLENLLNGLAGLFLLYVIHLTTRRLLIRLKLLKGEYGQTYSQSFVEQSLIMREPVGDMGIVDIFFLETELFGYIFESKYGEVKLEDTWHRVLKLVKEPRF